MGERLRVGYVPGVMPDKWLRRWAEALPGVELAAEPLGESDAGIGGASPTTCLDEDRVDVAVLRIVGGVESLRERFHVVVLYDEQSGVAGPKDHLLKAFDEIDVADLDGETIIEVGGRFAAGPAAALDLVAAGVGLVLLPRPLLRHLNHPDVVHRDLVGDVSTTSIAIVWPLDSPAEELVQEFVGVVRGRTPRSSRGSRGNRRGR